MGLWSQRLLDVALKWFGSHRHSWLEILLAFYNHAIAQLQSAIDDPHCALCVAPLARDAC